MDKKFLPEACDVHVMYCGESSIVLDVNNNVIFNTDSEFGMYLQGTKDDCTEEHFTSRLDALYKFGVFKKNNNRLEASYYNPIYKLSIEAYHGCNLSCVYCYGKSSGVYHNTGTSADFESLRNTINYFVNDFGKEAKSYEVNVVGAGEPLLNFNLIRELRAYCRELEQQTGKPIVFWVATNGTVFNEEMIDYFVNERQGLSISLDGPAEIHDELRPFRSGGGSHEVIAKWIKMIVEKSKGKGGLENFWVSAVVTSKHTSIIDIVRHLRMLEVRHAQIRPIKTVNTGYTLTEESVKAINLKYEELNNYLIEQAVGGKFDDLKIILNNRDFWGRHVIRVLERHKINYRCGAAKSKLNVLANGDIYPCDMSADISQLKLGSIKDGICKDKVYPFYAQEVSQKNACKECWCRYYCGGGCYVSAYLHNGNINDPDKIKCELVKRLVELAIIFVYEVQTKSPENFEKIRRFIKISSNILNSVYGL